jgi:WD40 repeat protein
VRVWDLDSGRQVERLEGHTGHVLAVAVSADGGVAVSGGDDRKVLVWDVDAGVPLHSLEGHTSEVRAVAVSADGSRAVSCSTDGVVRVWDLAAGAVTASFTAEQGIVSMATTMDARTIVAGTVAGPVHELRLVNAE